MKILTPQNIIIAILAIFLILTQTCSPHYKNEKDTIDSLTLANQKLVDVKNQQGDVIHTQTTIVTSSQEAMKKLTDSIFSLTKKQEKQIKDIVAFYRERTSTIIKNIPIPYIDTLSMKKFSDSVTQQCSEVIRYMNDSTITVPRIAKDSNTNYSASITVSRKNVTIDSLSIPDLLSLRVVEKKGGLFKKRSFEIQFKHSNPLVTTIGVNSVVYKPRPKLGLIPKIALIGLGVFLGTQIK